MYGVVIVLMAMVLLFAVVPAAFALRFLVGGNRLGPAARRVRRHLLAALIVMLGGFAITESTGIFAFISPLIAGLVVAIAAAISPQVSSAQKVSPRRQASLDERSPWRLIPRWSYVIPGLAAIILACAVTFFGFTSTTNDAGQHRLLDASLRVAPAGPDPEFTLIELHGQQADGYPGWYVGIPVLIGAAILSVITVIALYRITDLPLRGTEAERDIELRRRTSYSLILMAQTSGALLLSVSLMSIHAGALTGNLAQYFSWDRDLGGIAYSFPAFTGLAIIEYGAGVMGIALAITLLVTSWKVARDEPQH